MKDRGFIDRTSERIDYLKFTGIISSGFNKFQSKLNELEGKDAEDEEKPVEDETEEYEVEEEKVVDGDSDPKDRRDTIPGPPIKPTSPYSFLGEQGYEEEEVTEMIKGVMEGEEKEEIPQKIEGSDGFVDKGEIKRYLATWKKIGVLDALADCDGEFSYCLKGSLSHEEKFLLSSEFTSQFNRMKEYLSNSDDLEPKLRSPGQRKRVINEDGVEMIEKVTRELKPEYLKKVAQM